MIYAHIRCFKLKLLVGFAIENSQVSDCKLSYQFVTLVDLIWQTYSYPKSPPNISGYAIQRREMAIAVAITVNTDPSLTEPTPTLAKCLQQCPPPRPATVGTSVVLRARSSTDLAQDRAKMGIE